MVYVKPIVSTLSRANIGVEYKRIRLSWHFLLNLEKIVNSQHVTVFSPKNLKFKIMPKKE